MIARALAPVGAYEFCSPVHQDRRGAFRELFRDEWLATVGADRFRTAQVNCSISVRGALRGIHFADVPPGQAKFVTCVAGAAIDYVVDLREGSPTFAAVAAVELRPDEGRAVYLPEGLGHAFLALAEDTTMVYLCSTTYDPAREHTVNPLDDEVALPLPAGVDVVLSDRDRAAPTLSALRQDGALPQWATVDPGVS